MPQYDLSGNPLPEDNAPKTDLSGNPLPASAAPPPSMNPPPSAVWPPPPTGQPAYGQPAVNTSGMKGDVPPEIAALKWNWGAFFFPFLWTVGHKMTWGWAMLLVNLLSRTPGVGIVFVIFNFIVAVYLGLTGHKQGWQNRRFEGGVTQFIDVQKRWMIAGFILFGLIFGLAFIGGVMTGFSRAVGSHSGVP